MTWDELSLLCQLLCNQRLKVCLLIIITTGPRDFSGKSKQDIKQKIPGIEAPARCGNQWPVSCGIKVIFDSFIWAESGSIEIGKLADMIVLIG